MNAKYLTANILPTEGDGYAQDRFFAAGAESIASLLRQYRNCIVELKTLDGHFLLSYSPEDSIRECADMDFFRQLLAEQAKLADREKRSAEIQWVKPQTVSSYDILFPDWNIYRKYGMSDQKYREMLAEWNAQLEKLVSEVTGKYGDAFFGRFKIRNKPYHFIRWSDSLMNQKQNWAADNFDFCIPKEDAALKKLLGDYSKNRVKNAACLEKARRRISELQGVLLNEPDMRVVFLNGKTA